MVTHSKKMKKGYRLLIAAVVLLLAWALTGSHALAAGKTYEAYKASLPKGCEPVPRDCFEQAVAGKTFAMYDWAAWWPEDLYQGFEEEFGIKIVRDNYPGYDDALAKFKLDPKASYDYFFTNPKSVWYMSEWDILEPMNHDWIPNVNRYLAEDIKNASWDPGYKHAVLVTLGYDAYVVNTKFIDKNDPRIPSWKFVFEGSEAYQDRLVMRNEMNRVIGNTLKYLGYSLNSTDPGELKAAEEALLRLKPHIMAFDSWPKRAVMAGEVWVVEGVVHDYLTLGGLAGETNPFIPAYPPEGCLLSPSLIVIPKGGNNPAAGHLFTNYLFRPDKFARLINVIAYGHGHTTVDRLINEETKVWMTPPEEGYRQKCECLEPRAFTGEGEALRAKIWEKLK